LAGGSDAAFAVDRSVLPRDAKPCACDTDWVTGDEPMTGAQASYLKTLSEQTHRPQSFEEGLTKAEACERIEQLKSAKD
jgi:hypothetical protein